MRTEAPVGVLPAAISVGYTFGMKTAISIPDEVFKDAERYARHTRKSRSELYSKALAEYLARHAPDEITQVMNRVADSIGGNVDSLVRRAARRTLERTEW